MGNVNGYMKGFMFHWVMRMASLLLFLSTVLGFCLAHNCASVADLLHDFFILSWPSCFTLPSLSLYWSTLVRSFFPHLISLLISNRLPVSPFS